MDEWVDGWKIFLQLRRVLLYLDVFLVSLSVTEGKPWIVHLFDPTSTESIFS